MKVAALVISLTAIMLVSSCDSSVQPVESKLDAFTIYGLLDLTRDTSFFRVKNVNTPITPDSTRIFRGTVKLTNTATNETETLPNLQIVYDDITTHNFITQSPLDERTEYRIDVERNGRVVTSASATTPSLAEVTIDPAVPRCGDTVDINFGRLLKDELIFLNLGFNINEEFYFIRIFFDFQEVDEAPYGFSFAVESVVDGVVQRYLSLIPNPPRNCIDLRDPTIYLSYRHFGPGFLETTNLDELEQPGSFRRFGGIYDSLITVNINQTPPP